MNEWLINIQDSLFPNRCALCQRKQGGLICPNCRADLAWLTPNACVRCAEPLKAQGQICGRCLQTPPHFDSTLATFHYVNPVEWMIKRLKFHGELVFAQILGGYMGEALPQQANYCRPDVIIPVPLHTRRLQSRGYNQALELAKVAARRLDIPIDTSGVVRTRHTDEQSGLDAHERRSNITNAFEIVDDFSDKHVAIFDDVMSTGATVNELAQRLKQAGAQRVDVWVCARSG